MTQPGAGDPSVLISILASLLGGGLAGGIISVIANRSFHRRDLRTRFYPVLNNMYAAYVIRMDKPEGRYWTTIVEQLPAPEDEEFVEHRSTFISDLVQYNELKEARILRKAMLDNSVKGDHTAGKILRTDLAPESVALNACITTVHKKLKLN